MKNKRLFTICFALILCCAFHSGIYALDIEMIAGTGNLCFDSKAEEFLDDGVYEPTTDFLGSLYFSGGQATSIDYRIGVERDMLMRNRMIGTAGFSFNYGRIEVGPFLGLFNHPDQSLSAGGAGSIQLMYPGIVYISASGASTFATPGEYIQNEGTASIGFWVPNVVCSLSMYTGVFSTLANADLQITDKKLRYQFSADVHSKNVPYTIKIDMGYEELSRNYLLWKNGGDGSTDTVKSFFAGFTGTWRIDPLINMVLGLEVPLYLWTAEPLLKSDSGKMFFKAKGGIIWTVQEKEKPAPKPEEN